jgi:hypothetical protein
MKEEPKEACIAWKFQLASANGNEQVSRRSNSKASTECKSLDVAFSQR